jgi:hypothetical protein
VGNVARMGVVKNAYRSLESIHFKPKKKVGGGGIVVKIMSSEQKV